VFVESVAGHNGTNMLLNISFVVETWPMEGFLMLLDVFQMIVLRHIKATSRLISARMP
jgi:hypothetical protein